MQFHFFPFTELTNSMTKEDANVKLPGGEDKHILAREDASEDTWGNQYSVACSWGAS